MTPKGGITPHARYQVSAKRAEVLFVDYIAEHLNPTGRAAIIVPEGIVFQSQTAYKNLRKMLVDGNYLYGVISLPAGVFNPYSGVKTSILLIDRTQAKERDSILFVKLNNDGFDLGAQRREIKGSEIPDVISIFKDYQKGVDVSGRENVINTKKATLARQDYILVGERYIASTISEGRWPLIRLGDCCNIFVGGTPSKQESSFGENGTIKWISSKYIGDNGRILNYDLITEEAVRLSATKIAPPKSTILVTRVSVGKRAYADDYYAINQDMTCLVPDERINSEYLFFIASFLTRLIERDAQGIGVRGVTQKYVSDLQIPLPPLAAQEEIVAEIEEYQMQIKTYQEKIGETAQKIKDKIAEVWGE